MFDVIVVGAGPAGTAAAITMAESGLRVVLLDRQQFPRDKICGDAVSGKCMQVLKDLGLSGMLDLPSAQASWGITFSSPSGDSVEIPFSLNPDPNEPIGFVCVRERFDNLLLERAKTAGVHVVEGASVTSLIQNESCVSGVRAKLNKTNSPTNSLTKEIPVIDGHISLLAPIVIGADGANSIVARELGVGGLNADHHSAGIRAYYKGVTGFTEANHIEIHFVDDALPGYFWIFPMADGMANVGIGMLSSAIKKNHVQLKSLLSQLLVHPRFKQRFERATLQGNIQGWGLPLGSKPRAMAGSGWMLVGDAASLIDPFTGEGIGNALISGQAAGNWGIKAHSERNFSLSFLNGYQAEVLGRFKKELQLSHSLQKLGAKRWLLNVVIRKAARSKDLSELITNMFNSVDDRKKLASPFFYLKLLFS